jgi:tRNA(Ile)-lysidine synthase
MRPKRDDIVRPLLTIGRADTALVCADAKITPREDASNRDQKYARNRIRRTVLPELERINPQVRAALARLADAAAEVADASRDTAERALVAAIDGDHIDLTRLEGPHRDDALALAWLRATGRALAERQRTALATLAATTHGSAAIDLPGGRALREYGRLRLVTGRPTAESAFTATDQPLALGRAVEWGGWTIRLSTTAPPDGALAVRAPEGALLVRSRRPGDRLAGRLRIKVQDLFTNAKVPLRARASHPLVALASGEIWWVVGLKRADGNTRDGMWIEAWPGNKPS